MSHNPRSSWLEELAYGAANLSRSAKRLVMVSADCLGIPLAAYISIWLISPADSIANWWLIAAPLAVGVPIQHFLGFYRSVVRFMGLNLLASSVKSMTVIAACFLGLLLAANVGISAARMAAAFWLLGVVYIVGSRVLARCLIESIHADGERVVIYGAGASGAHLAESLKASRNYFLTGFVDDNPTLAGAMVNGCEVHSARDLPELIEQFNVTRVLLAMPSASRRRRQEILGRLEPLAVRVQTVPDIADILTRTASVADVRDVDVNDLLGRDAVPPNPDLLDACIYGKNVMVTGAGGSIGSELCVQIAQLSPKALLLLEMSEAALYTVNQRVRQLLKREGITLDVYPLIGSAHHKTRMQDVLQAYRVDTVYHAAAYKHVPLVEHNMIEGIHNNVFGTLHTAQAAIAAGVKSFVLVSTDKAVKPLNVMGATKRLAELVLQALDRTQFKTTFSMVRFGNVLASSGSVVPLFREQIRSGGPVTVTHPEIYRYFMTIPEAASLVIQAGSMASGGDVFVLDMGESVRIRDLAEKMIRLMGLSIRDKDNPEGDIEIQYTGLRPAEKLYEELLIGDNVMGTIHPSIMRAEEEFISWDALEPLLDDLWHACQRLDCVSGRNLLIRSVSGYAPAEVMNDLVWQERNRGSDSPLPDRRAASRESNVTPLKPDRAVASGRDAS